ncbi:ferredoxin-dependent glutamate synthase [Pyrolobus fumarii 1A]|uniref:Archaeal glutamate synthase [NADPH] n=1 Tax=Pyrolobus fumarii (strain DSM 11204 / 1A) TaxID=694429 RepID=G0EH78_PYRF1|nr:glutamate synthase-related protein [Pyrolobus fumarii]AEM39302.1 ferredoxin-dependent glutamate synthase [Pyrolobus fumarii 1A]
MAGKTVRIHAGGKAPREVNREVKRAVESGASRIIVEDPGGIHYLAVGLEASVEIVVRGSVGYFVGGLAHGPRIVVEGNAGWFPGDNMTSGEVIVEGDTGNGAGQYLFGGTVVIKGDAGDRVAALAKRGFVIIGGDVGLAAGLYMMGGTLVILGNAGPATGEMIIGGTIYVGGDVESLGKNAKLAEASAEEVEQINQILARYGLRGKSSYYKVTPISRRPAYQPPKRLPTKPLVPKFRVEVEPLACIGCGACVQWCPKKVLELREVNGRKVAVPVRVVECVGCFSCVKVCPTGAVRVYPLPELKRGVWTSSILNYHQEAMSTGIPPVRGTGAREIRLPSLDDLVILPGQLSRPPIDPYREPCDTEVVLGARFAERPLRLKAPIIIGAMSFGSISKEAKIAIAKAAAKLGIAVNTGEGGMLPEERQIAPILIAQYASGRFGVSARYLKSADAIEIKIGQGAKPGQGGLLLGEKVTEEIARIRGIPVGADAVSPARHLDIVGPEDLKMKIEELREATDWKIPIAVKIAAGRVEDDVKIVAKAGADIVVIDAKPAGTGASPHIVTEHAGYPLMAAVVAADRALREIGLRDEVNIVVSGGVRHGADIAKLLALGADAVAIGTAALIGIGCTLCGLCHTGRCPAGIATQDPKLRKRLNVEMAAKKLENLLKSMIKEMCMLAQLAGKTSPLNLEKEDLRALSVEASMITGVKLVGLERPVTPRDLDGL